MADNTVQSDEPEPPEPYDVTIDALSGKTKRIISELLNPRKILRTEDGLARDWQGLAGLIGITAEQIPHLQQQGADPTVIVFDLWKDKDKDSFKIKQLLKHLEEIDRYDVIDDIKHLLVKDVKHYNERRERAVTNGDVKPTSLDLDKFILTRDDVVRVNEGLPPQTYDAFVLFADDDIDFATELIETMEKQKNLRFCVKDRDLVVGVFEHDTIIKLIAERCNRLLVIISPAFFKSPANKFFLNFAQAIGIDQSQRKIVPCMYTNCEVPLELKCYYILDYNRKGKLWNFWDKLLDALQTPQHDPAKKHNINRSVSHHVRSTSTHPKPIIDKHHVNGLKPKKECVTFNSLVNIADTSKNVVTAATMVAPSSSLHTMLGDKSLNDTNGNNKTKTSWYRRLLPMRKNASNDDLQVKGKRRFWQRHSKRSKVAVAN